MTDFFSEMIIPEHRQQLAIDEVIHEETIDAQHILIFTNKVFGKVMILDDVVQTTTKDEFVYHEMLTHVPLLAHGNAKRVLVIGGGDGGILRHVLKHHGVEHVTLVELEAKVIELTKKYMPEICGDAFNDPRASVSVGDGCAFVKETQQTYDVIIVDSTDAVGPGAVLFSVEFYANCKRILTPGGLIVTQSGVPFSQQPTIQMGRKNLSESFSDVTFYTVVVPTYISGQMALGFASDNPNLKNVDMTTLIDRQREAGITDCKYYTPRMHEASFALPKYFLDILAEV